MYRGIFIEIETFVKTAWLVAFAHFFCKLKHLHNRYKYVILKAVKKRINLSNVSVIGDNVMFMNSLLGPVTTVQL